MGEYAEEAFYLGIDQMDSNLRVHGCIAPGDPRYDNEVWRGVDGKVREVNKMDPMHLCFVLKQLENSKGKIKNRMPSIIGRLQWLVRNGRFSKEDFEFHLEGVRAGLYCFYPEEEDSGLEDYYANMLKHYKYFTPPRRIFD